MVDEWRWERGRWGSEGIVHVNDDFCIRWQNNFTCEKHTHTESGRERQTHYEKLRIFVLEIKGNGRLYHKHKHKQPPAHTQAQIRFLLLFLSFSCSLSCAVCSIILLPTFRAVPSNIIMLEHIRIYFMNMGNSQHASVCVYGKQLHWTSVSKRANEWMCHFVCVWQNEYFYKMKMKMKIKKNRTPAFGKHQNRKVLF